MGGIFNLEGPFYRWGNVVADVMILSLIWLVVSLPIVTIGASTTALFYVTTRRISNKEGYLFRDFFGSFRSNFKIATVLWLIWLAIAGLVFFNLRVLGDFDFNPILLAILYPVQIIILIELFISSLYLFPIIARFEMGYRETAKSAFFMANRHLLTTFSVVLIAVAIILAAVMWFEPILIIGMGIYAYGSSYMFMKVFKKYRPEMDEENFHLEPLAELNLDEILDEADAAETANAVENNISVGDYKPPTEE